MDEIFKLIDINKKKGQRSIQLVNQNFRKKEVSKDNILYDAIISGKYNSDEEASLDMFGADPGNRNYRNTKGKLKQKLLNHLYFLDYEKNGYTNYDKVEYETRHVLHQCRILFREDAADIAMRRLPLIYKTSLEFEFIDMAIASLEMMRMQYAREGKTTPYTETNEEIKNLRYYLEAINSSEEKYQEALVYINKSTSSQNKAIKDIPEYIQHIEKNAKKYKSKRMNILSKKLQIIYNSILYRFEENILLCDELEKKYLQKSLGKITVDLSKLELAFTKLYSIFQEKKYEQGIAYSEKSLKIFKSGSSEWFKFIEYYFLTCMHAKKFQKAASIFRLVRTNKNFNQLPEEISDRWLIYRAYLIFFFETKLLKWGFDLDEYLSIEPEYPKELQGYSISILVVQFMYLLRDGRVNDVKKKIGALEKYSSVHLDKRHNYRNSIFIRMLSIITDKEFNYELIAEKGDTYLKKLHRFKIPFDLQNEIEVLPFEDIWHYVLDILKTNKYYIHYRFYSPAETS